jgi:hypothetical protein
MPYTTSGKCVYKKKRDGSRGEKVGCTKGSVDKYLKALYANVDEKLTKEDKEMKLTQEELMRIIKEEVANDHIVEEQPIEEALDVESMRITMQAMAKLAPLVASVLAGGVALDALITHINKLRKRGDQ